MDILKPGDEVINADGHRGRVLWIDDIRGLVVADWRWHDDGPLYQAGRPRDQVKRYSSGKVKV